MSEEEDLSKGQKAYLKGIVNKFKSDAQKAIDEINNLKVKLIQGENNEPDLYIQFQEAQSYIKQTSNQFLNLNDDIFKSKTTGQLSLAEQLTEFKTEYQRSKVIIDDIIHDINVCKDDLLGYEDGLGHKILGIKDKFEEQLNKLDSLHIENKQRQENLFSEIEGLLKGASTVALAKAFNEHKKSFDTSNTFLIGIFLFSIVLMMGLSIFAFVHVDYKFEEMWKYTLGNLPFIGGAIWLAIFSNKQRSQNKRLQQEYAFKEDVAKVYYGLKKEVEELGNSELGKKLNEKMLESIISVVTYNPSVTLDNKYHNDKGPILESLSSVKELITKK